MDDCPGVRRGDGVHAVLPRAKILRRRSYNHSGSGYLTFRQPIGLDEEQAGGGFVPVRPCGGTPGRDAV